MQRVSLMTLGFVLIFVGAQLNLVESYVLTPRFSGFLSEQAASFDVPDGGVNSANSQFQSPYYQASYSASAPTNPMTLPRLAEGPRVVTPPKWFCWPILFLGTVLFLQGLSSKRN